MHEQSPRPRGGSFVWVRPAGRTFLEGKVLYGPDTGNRLLHGKGGPGDWAS